MSAVAYTYKKMPNELHREFLGVNGFNFGKQHNSSSREQMFSSHMSQALVLNGSTERYCQTGVEREYANYTFSVKMPVDAEIIRVIHRYPRKEGLDAIKFNPQDVLIYEDVGTKEIGMLNVPRYCSYHQYFGFEYKKKSAYNEVHAGAFIPKGTILLDSPSVTDSGGYKYGVEANIAFMSHPAVSEDGVLVSRDFLPRFGFKNYEVRRVEWGSKCFALNLYGDENNFKPFPDIGDVVRPDGILMCLRTYEKGMSVIEQNINDIREVDHIFDKKVYAAGAGGVIVDIKIHRDGQALGHTSPMDDQPEKYDTARRAFYSEILREYYRLKRERKEQLRLTPEFHRMVVEAISVMEVDSKKVTKLFRKDPLDECFIEFVIQYDVIPTDGFKLTDCHGGKGVICHVANPEDMPVDENGVRADIVMDGFSTISRMNLGRLYEQFYNAASRDVMVKIRKDLQIGKTDRNIKERLAEIYQTDPDRFNRSWEYLMGFYAIISPKTHHFLASRPNIEDAFEHLAYSIKSEIYLYLPPDAESESVDIVQAIQKYYRPTYGPVTYVGNSGRKVTTKKSVRIGSLYVILLEKTGDDWTAVSSGKLQHFGVLSQVTNSDKFSKPTRTQAIRALGEAEVRIFVSYVGAQITADIIDRNNNPLTHKVICENIFEADRPTDITSVVNRKEIPLGGARPIQLIKHIAQCGGWKFTYQNFVPEWARSKKGNSNSLRNVK